MPVIGLATTELVTVIRNGVNGYIDTRIDRLVDVMKDLLENPAMAERWGQAAARTARERFGIGRFVADWQSVLREATD